MEDNELTVVMELAVLNPVLSRVVLSSLDDAQQSATTVARGAATSAAVHARAILYCV